jgi:hypothetical protein
MRNSRFRGATHPAVSRVKRNWDEPNQREFS